MSSTPLPVRFTFDGFNYVPRRFVVSTNALTCLSDPVGGEYRPITGPHFQRVPNAYRCYSDCQKKIAKFLKKLSGYRQVVFPALLPTYGLSMIEVHNSAIDAKIRNGVNKAVSKLVFRKWPKFF